MVLSLLAALQLHVAHAQAAPLAIRYSAKAHTAHQQDVLTAKVAGCSVTWKLPNAEHVRYGMVDSDVTCRRTFSVQMKLHQHIMQQLMARKQPPLLHTFNWGFVQSKNPAHYSVVLRLASALKRSPLWKLDKGKPAAGGVDKVVKRLVNEAGVLKELTQVFAQSGMSIYVTKVDKIEVNPVGRLKMKALFAKRGLNYKHKVPHDFRLTLAIEPRPELLFPDPQTPRSKY